MSKLIGKLFPITFARKRSVVQSTEKLIIPTDKLFPNNKVPNDFFIGHDSERIMIPDHITSIGDNFCMYCRKLKQFHMPMQLEEIGDYFLCDCCELNYLFLNYKLQRIGNGFLSGCTSLGTLTIPCQVRTIGDDFAKNCKSLVSVVFHTYNLEKIGKNPLLGCTSLKYIYYYNPSILGILPQELKERVTLLGWLTQTKKT